MNPVIFPEIGSRKICGSALCKLQAKKDKLWDSAVPWRDSKLNKLFRDKQDRGQEVSGFQAAAAEGWVRHGCKETRFLTPTMRTASGNCSKLHAATTPKLQVI